MTASKPVTPRPPLRMKLSIASGNLIQAGGLAAGAALLALAATRTGPGPVRLAVARAGFLAVYDCSHAIGHYLAGRAVGIRFRFYGIRGTDHPEDYPPGFRQLMSAVPFWSVITDKDSMRAAPAGTTSTWPPASSAAATSPRTSPGSSAAPSSSAACSSPAPAAPACTPRHCSPGRPLCPSSTSGTSCAAPSPSPPSRLKPPVWARPDQPIADPVTTPFRKPAS